MREIQRSITSRSSHSVATPTPPSDMRTAPCHRADHPGSAHARLAGCGAAARREFMVDVSNSHADAHTWHFHVGLGTPVVVTQALCRCDSGGYLLRTQMGMTSFSVEPCQTPNSWRIFFRTSTPGQSSQPPWEIVRDRRNNK